MKMFFYEKIASVKSQFAILKTELIIDLQKKFSFEFYKNDIDFVEKCQKMIFEKNHMEIIEKLYEIRKKYIVHISKKTNSTFDQCVRDLCHATKAIEFMNREHEIRKTTKKRQTSSNPRIAGL